MRSLIKNKKLRQGMGDNRENGCLLFFGFLIVSKKALSFNLEGVWKKR
jgi:hypothetical protein